MSDSDFDSDSEWEIPPDIRQNMINNMTTKDQKENFENHPLRKGDTSFEHLKMLETKYFKDNTHLKTYVSKGCEINDTLRSNKHYSGQQIEKNINNELKHVSSVYSDKKVEYITVYRSQTKQWDNDKNQGFLSTATRLLPFGSHKMKIYVPNDIKVGIVDISGHCKTKNQNQIPTMEIILPTNTKLSKLRDLKIHDTNLEIYVVDSEFSFNNLKRFIYLAENDKHDEILIHLDKNDEKQNGENFGINSNRSCGERSSVIKRRSPRRSCTTRSTKRRSPRRSCTTRSIKRRSPRRSCTTRSTKRRSPRRSCTTRSTKRRSPRRFCATRSTKRRSPRRSCTTRSTKRRSPRRSCV